MNKLRQNYAGTTFIPVGYNVELFLVSLIRKYTVTLSGVLSTEDNL